jgi:starch synthase
VVSRLVYQKGLDLTEAVSEYIVKSGGQIAIIGRGEPEEEQAMRELALRFPGKSAYASASTKPTPDACSPAATSC